MILNEFFNLPQVFEKDMEKNVQVKGQDVNVNVVIDKLKNFVSNAEQQIENADYDQQIRYATIVRDRALQALEMIAQGGNTPEAANAAFRYMQTGEQGVDEGIVDTVKSIPGKASAWLNSPIKGMKGQPRSNAVDSAMSGLANAHGVAHAEEGVAEAKDDYVPPKEADYGPEYQAMVRRVGQKAKAQEKAKQQQPKAPVRESRLALLKQIIQSLEHTYLRTVWPGCWAWKAIRYCDPQVSIFLYQTYCFRQHISI
jgi:hypothetical protein